MMGERPLHTERIESVLAQRGPDGRGERQTSDGWMLHRRLAVLDPSDASAQPFRLTESDSDVLFNGEIYNFRELARDLSLPLRSSGDTEVFGQVLHGFKSPDALMGMYAGATIERRTVRLTRDRFGIKPLYRSISRDGRLAVASQLRCFRDLPVDRLLSRGAVASFLRFGSVQGRTMWDGVDEVWPGTTETWIDSALTSFSSLSPIREGADLAGALQRSIERHLVSDIDLCILLSAGLDSAIIAVLATRLGSRPLSITVASNDENDESAGAVWMANQLGLEHKVVRVSDDEILGQFGRFFDAMDQPSIDGLNTFIVTDAIQEAGLRVALSGLGADELFGGYSSFRRAFLTNRLRRIPAPLLRMIVRQTSSNRSKTDDWVDARGSLSQLMQVSREVFTREEVRRMCGEAWEPPLPELDGADQAMRSEIWRYMSPMLLRDCDSFSMANSVEVRLPFLDEEVVACAFGRSARERAMIGKQVLVDSVNSAALDEIASRRKTGFALPMDRWMRTSFRERYDDALAPDSPLAQVIDIEEARRISRSGSWSRQWAMVVLNEWLSRNVD